MRDCNGHEDIYDLQEQTGRLYSLRMKAGSLYSVAMDVPDDTVDVVNALVTSISLRGISIVAAL